MNNTLFRKPIGAGRHHFLLVDGSSERTRDGWFEVSWRPDWIEATGGQAKLHRRRLRGRWIRIGVKNSLGSPIYRRLSFYNSATRDHGGAPNGVAVRLSWDDRIALLNDEAVLAPSASIELELSEARWWHWPQILMRVPRENAEGAILGLVGTALAVIGIAFAIAVTDWAGVRGEPEMPQSSSTETGEPSVVPINEKAPASPSVSLNPRWSLLGGDMCELVVRSVGTAAGSRGLTVDFDARADQELVIRVDAKPQVGSWTLRVDDGEQAPSHLPLIDYPAFRVTGSDHYQFMIYTDDIGSSISVKDMTIRLARGLDSEVPLVWPTSGPKVDQDRHRQSVLWTARFGLVDSDSEVAQARILARWVHARSRVVGASASRHLSLGSPHSWSDGSSRTIDGDCGVFACALREACAIRGIICRPVHLGSQQFEMGENLNDTHALVEVFDKKQGRWFLVDPTFNVVFESGDGRMLGLAELIEFAQSGITWRPTQIGPSRPGRGLSEYYLPFKRLLWLADAPAVPALGEEGAEYRSRAQTVREVVRAKYPSLGAP